MHPFGLYWTFDSGHCYPTKTIIVDVSPVKIAYTQGKPRHGQM